MLQIYKAVSSTLKRPVVSEEISAGFPSPALDFCDKTIDLNEYIIKHPSSTFYGRVKGESMINKGISEGDLLVIDKSLSPENGKIAVCCIDGKFIIKEIRLEKNIWWLIPANNNYKPIEVTSEDFLIWGIVTHIIKSF